MVFITYIEFNGDGNKTIEINENSIVEFAQKSYERAIDKWFKILCTVPDYKYSWLPTSEKIKHINSELQQQKITTGIDYSFIEKQFETNNNIMNLTLTDVYYQAF